MQEAERLYRLAAAAGDAEAQECLAVFQEKNGNPEGAERTAWQALQGGNAEMLYGLAWRRHDAGAVQDAQRLYVAAADAGYAPAQLALAELHPGRRLRRSRATPPAGDPPENEDLTSELVKGRSGQVDLAPLSRSPSTRPTMKTCAGWVRHARPHGIVKALSGSPSSSSRPAIPERSPKWPRNEKRAMARRGRLVVPPGRLSRRRLRTDPIGATHRQNGDWERCGSPGWPGACRRVLPGGGRRGRSMTRGRSSWTSRRRWRWAGTACLTSQCCGSSRSWRAGRVRPDGLPAGQRSGG